MSLQTLVFNTTEKTIILYEGQLETSTILFSYDNVPTVKVNENYYEVMSRRGESSSIPVLRLPILNTNMVIKN
jgi:hypothetical protein